MNIEEIKTDCNTEIKWYATQDGIVKVATVFDQENKFMYSRQELIIPKSVFVSAYQKYIKENK